MTVELVASPLVGFRYWCASKEGELRSINLSHRWPANGRLSSSVPGAEQRVHAHHGIHAYYRPRAVYGRLPYVSGLVVAWGWIIEHQAGFRAQHARVLAIEEPPDTRPDFYRRVAERYEVPFLSRPELVEYGKWWGEVRDDEFELGKCKCEARCTCDEVLDNPTKED